MKTVFKRLVIFSALAALSILTPVVMAQKQESGENRLQQMGQQLNLTEDQKTKLKPILQEEAQKLRELKNDTSSSRQEKMQKAKQIHSEYKPQIDAILTPEQQQRWQQMKQEAKSRAKQHRKSDSD